MDFKKVLLERIAVQDVKTYYEYHDTRNPVLWDGDTILPEAEDKLKKSAQLFIDYLNVPKSAVKDIVLTGSSVNFNWNSMSDIDLHVIIDKSKIDMPEQYVDDYLQMKRTIFNDRHNIKIHGMDVEFYPQDSNDVTTANAGFYSLKKDKWLKQPKKETPKVDDFAVKAKAAALMNDIDDLEKSGHTDSNAIQKIRDDVWGMRNTGLHTNGEFSVENLAFKTLRNSGYLDKIFKLEGDTEDREYSVE